MISVSSFVNGIELEPPEPVVCTDLLAFCSASSLLDSLRKQRWSRANWDPVFFRGFREKPTLRKIDGQHP